MHLEPSPITSVYRFDGLLGQEDELEDFHKDKLEPPIDDEDPRVRAEQGGAQTTDLEDLKRRAGIRPM
jgi:hypothetical protein